MSRVFRIVCACVAGASLMIGLGGAGGARQSCQPAPSKAAQTVTIDGRLITVEVDLVRDMMPGVGPRRDQMRATVRLSTDSDKGLPDRIRSVRLWLSNPKRESWKPALTPVQTFQHDPKSLMLVARGGPRWAVDSEATATVLLVHGTMTYRFKMPVKVEGVH